MSDDNQEIVHWVASWMCVGTQLRQRCGWCGAVLIDVDLSMIGRPTADWQEVSHDDPRCGYPTWPEGGFVAHDGAAWWVLEGEFTDTPEQSCMRMPHWLTGSGT